MILTHSLHSVLHCRHQWRTLSISQSILLPIALEKPASYFTIYDVLWQSYKSLDILIDLGEPALCKLLVTLLEQFLSWKERDDSLVAFHRASFLRELHQKVTLKVEEFGIASIGCRKRAVRPF